MIINRKFREQKRIVGRTFLHRELLPGNFGLSTMNAYNTSRMSHRFCLPASSATTFYEPLISLSVLDSRRVSSSFMGRPNECVLSG